VGVYSYVTTWLTTFVGIIVGNIFYIMTWQTIQI
jgi:hypothetical protein